MNRPRPARMPLPPQWGRWQPGAAIRLRALTSEEAWVVAAILEDILDAIWAFHGAAMADYQGALFPDWDQDPDGGPHPPDPEPPDSAADVDF